MAALFACALVVIMGFLGLAVDYNHASGVKANMQAVLADIKSGAFAKRFIDDQDAGAPEFKSLREKGAAHPIEATGRELRKLMAWVDSDRDSDYVEGSAAR